MVILPGIDGKTQSRGAPAARAPDAHGTSHIVGASVHIGLDRLLYSTSPVDRLLHSADPLARFRTGSAPAEPSPMATPGMTVRVGDIHAEIATRHDIGAVRIPDAALRADVVLRGDDAVLTARVAAGSGTRGVEAVRDPAAVAALPQRINGAAGIAPDQRGISVLFGFAVAGPGTSILSGQVSIAGLVDVIAGGGVPILSAHDAPPGALLVYTGSGAAGMVAELRTTSGFAGANGGSALPLTGAAMGRDGEGFTLVGVFAAPPASSDRIAAGQFAQPDGSAIPAGQPIAAGEPQNRVGEAPNDPADSDRPYVYSIWYDILALRFAAAGVALLGRSRALRDVVWATAIEHGPFAAADAGDVLSRVAQSTNLAKADDGAIIAALFAERARTTGGGELVHYPQVLPFNRSRVIARLAEDAAVATSRIVMG